MGYAAYATKSPCYGCEKRYAKVVDGKAVMCRTNCEAWKKYKEDRHEKIQQIVKAVNYEKQAKGFLTDVARRIDKYGK